MTRDIKEPEVVKSAAVRKEGEVQKPGNGPLALLLPPDTVVLAEARRLAADPTARIEDLATCIGQDPIIVVDLLRVANAMFFSGGRTPITSTKTAAIRLGGEVLIETLDGLAKREPFEDAQVMHWLEVHRMRSKRASIVSTILAQALARTLVEDCQVAGLLQFYGELLAVAYLKQRYTKLAGDVPRGSIFYRLVQDFKFDCETIGVSYLRRQGIPENLLFIMDREGRPKTPDRAVMKPICLSAAEFVEAFDQGKLEKFSPGKTIPPKSALRTLQMTDSQYVKVYERVAEFLFSFKIAEERKKRAAKDSPAQTESVTLSKRVDFEPKERPAVASEIDALVRGDAPPEEEVDPADELEFDDGLGELEAEAEPTSIFETELDLPQDLNAFNLDQEPEKREARQSADTAPIVAPPKIHTRGGSEYLSAITDLCTNAKSSEELLSGLLAKLVKPGPFEKAALIVVSADRKHAIVVASRGPIAGNGTKLSLDDPLNPLAACFSKVQSFGNRSSNISPFGSKAFAVAPIDVDHTTPVALYADCGLNGSLTFEARRIFRNVVELLNQKLPSLPGGILNELST